LWTYQGNLSHFYYYFAKLNIYCFNFAFCSFSFLLFVKLFIFFQFPRQIKKYTFKNLLVLFLFRDEWNFLKSKIIKNFTNNLIVLSPIWHFLSHYCSFIFATSFKGKLDCETIYLFLNYIIKMTISSKCSTKKTFLQCRIYPKFFFFCTRLPLGTDPVTIFHS